MKWENRLSTIRAMIALTALAVLPFAAPRLSRSPLGAALSDLLPVEASPRFRQVTGFVVVALMAAAIGFAQHLHHRVPLPVPRRWARAIHMALGTLVAAAILVHTAGHWGYHLNGYLLAAVLLAILVALLGKLLENWILTQRTVTPPLTIERRARLHQAQCRLRPLWLHLHLLLVVASLALLAFHVLSAYYF